MMKLRHWKVKQLTPSQMASKLWNQRSYPDNPILYPLPLSIIHNAQVTEHGLQSPTLHPNWCFSSYLSPFLSLV